MSEPVTLAIDAGTGSCRAVIFDLSGSQLGLGQREWAHAALPGVPGSQVFDTAGGWRLICECVREALASAGIAPTRVAGVSATSMREGMVLYDRAGNEIWACPNVDGRAGEEGAALVASGEAEVIYAEGGDWVSITSPARFRWIKRHQPEIYDAVAHVGMLSDWIVTRLCGEFRTDPSAGSSSGLFALSQRTWSERVLDLLELPREVLPPVLDAGTVAGTVTARAAEQTGLAPGTPVAVGGADTQLGLIGLGLTEANCSTVVGGTFWQATVTLDHALIDPQRRLRTLCHSAPGQWMMEGIGFYSGFAFRWFRDAFCDLERERAAASGRSSYELMEEAALSVPPGSNGVVGLFSNVMDAKRWVQTAPGFLGFDIGDPSASGKKECIRAIQEAAAYAAFGHFEIVTEITGRPLSQAVFTGGAANGRLWPQIVADVLGVPVRVPQARESTALGAAMYAAVGAGLAGSVAELGAGTRFEATFEPDASVHETYLELFARWRAVYGRTLEMVDDGVIRPLWETGRRMTRVDIQAMGRQALGEIGAVLDRIRPDEVEALCGEIRAAGRIACYGVGREGLMIRALCMRLMHLGLEAHVVGDMTTPPLGRGDLLIVSAGPGWFSTVDALVGVAAAAGARTVVFTAQPGGRVPARADRVVHLPAQTMADDQTAAAGLLPMGSLYEAVQLVLYDLVSLILRDELGQTPDDMRARHTNLE